MKILLTGAFEYTKEQIEDIESLGYEIVFIQDEREKINIDVSNVEVVVCNGLFLYNDISKFKRLKIIQLTSAGMDRVPIEYVRENNIEIYNAKEVYSVPMAEWVILRILEIYKKSKEFNLQQENHEWKKHRNLLELTDKKAAIIGYGNVGREVAKRLKAFDVYVKAVDRKYVNDIYTDESSLLKDLREVVQNSDIVILTLPLTDETKNIFNKDIFKFMDDNTVLINVSRGEIINESDLIKELEKERFLGVSLDVFKIEPLCKNSKLWDFKNVTITPHNSFISDRVQLRLFNLIFENLKIISYNEYMNLVNI